MDATLDMYLHDKRIEQRADVQDITPARSRGETQTLLVAIGAVPYKCPVAPFEAAFIADDVIPPRVTDSGVDIVVIAPVAWSLPVHERGVHWLRGEERPFPCRRRRSSRSRRSCRICARRRIAAMKIWSVYPQRPDFVKATGVCNPRGFVPGRTSPPNASRAATYCIEHAAFSATSKAAPKGWASLVADGRDGRATRSCARRVTSMPGLARTAECGAGRGCPRRQPDGDAQCVKDPEGGKPRLRNPGPENRRRGGKARLGEQVHQEHSARAEECRPSQAA